MAHHANGLNVLPRLLPVLVRASDCDVGLNGAAEDVTLNELILEFRFRRNGTFISGAESDTGIRDARSDLVGSAADGPRWHDLNLWSVGQGLLDEPDNRVVAIELGDVEQVSLRHGSR